MIKPARASLIDTMPVFIGLPPDIPAAANEASATGGVILANIAK